MSLVVVVLVDVDAAASEKALHDEVMLDSIVCGFESKVLFVSVGDGIFSFFSGSEPVGDVAAELEFEKTPVLKIFESF